MISSTFSIWVSLSYTLTFVSSSIFFGPLCSTWNPSTALSWIAFWIVYLWSRLPYNSSVVRGRSPNWGYGFSPNLGVPVNPYHSDLPKNLSNSLLVFGVTALWHSSTTNAILRFFILLYSEVPSCSLLLINICIFWIVVTITCLSSDFNFFLRSFTLSVSSTSTRSLFAYAWNAIVVCVSRSFLSIRKIALSIAGISINRFLVAL